jgi:hypothetical protein
MKFFVPLVTCAMILVSTVTAVPAPSTRLAKRGEGIHLMNCVQKNGGSGRASIVAYCANDDDNCQPGDSFYNQKNICLVGDGHSFFKWEGQAQRCHFKTGTTFTWNVALNAAKAPNYSLIE